MLPKLTKKEVNPRDYGTGVAAQSFFSTHDMMCMALQGHWPSLKRLLRESSGPEAELELPDHPSYPNPLLAEAVCEFRFASRPDAPWKPSGPGDFFKAVQPNYPRLEPITEQTLELIIAPDGVPAQRIGPSQVRFRLSHVSERFFITVTGGVLSLSALRPYPGWASFKSEIGSVWPHFIEVFNPAALEQIGMRYINRVERDTAEERPARWLRESGYVPRAILSSGPGYVSRTEVQVDVLNRRMVTVAHDATSTPGALIFDIDGVWRRQADILWDRVSENLEHLHDEIWTIFNEAKSDEL